MFFSLLLCNLYYVFIFLSVFGTMNCSVYPILCNAVGEETWKKI